ncbi:MAG: asparagine synthase [Rhizobacter sp.]|nr:asparagine synthase [Rhizobacter sp.]
MLRYVALHWNTRSDAATAQAMSLATAIRSQPGWRLTFSGEGLQVLVTGERAGINESYPLAGNRGLVLGRLFDSEARRIEADHFVTAPGETTQIEDTGGRHLVDRYWGRYIAFVVSPGADAQVLRDPSGGLPCFLVRHGDIDLCFSWLEDLLNGPPALPVPEIDWPSLAAQLALGDLGGRPTALEGVTQVLAGECVILGPGARRSRLLWKLSDHALAAPLDDVSLARDTLRRTVRQCVRAWAEVYPSLVLRLSGGLDSSILAACLSADQTHTAVTCLNYHSPGADSDERHFARLAASRAGLELVELRRDEDFVLERILDLALMPRPAPYAGRIAGRTDAELARRIGSTVMFTGAGGDQLFFEFQRWWPAADYLRIRGIDRGLPAALMDAARLGKVSLKEVLRQAIADRLRKGLPPPLIHRPWTLVSEAVWSSTADAERFAHPVRSEVAELPIGKLEQVLQLVQVGSYYDPWHREAAPELVHPLLSQPLIELCLRIPSYLLAHKGQARGLVREAFWGDLPPEIARRRSKGGLQEVLQTILDRNLGFTRELLLDGVLVRQGLVDRQRAEQALSAQAGAGSVRPGEIHMLLAIEAWHRRWTALRSQRG